MCLLVAIAVIVSALELLWLAARGEFGPGGMWNWRVIAVPRGGSGLLARIFARRETVPALLVLRLAAAAILLRARWDTAAVLAALGVLCVTQLTLNARLGWGDDGSDQMLTLVVVALALAAASRDAVILALSVAFVGVQATLCYLCSGVAKACGRSWRDGSALRLILGHHSHGHRRLHDFLRAHPRLARLVTYGVIAFLLAFPLQLWLPWRYAWAFFAGGLAFHAGIAATMRLNGFFFAFATAYPALVFLHGSWSEVLGLVRRIAHVWWRVLG